MGKVEIIGIDAAAGYSVVSVFQNGRAEVIKTETGAINMPSVISFTDTDILIGEAAKNHSVYNPENTVHDIKRLIGRRFSDLNVQNELKYLSYKVVDVDDKPCAQVMFKGEMKIFTPEELLAMILRKLKKMSEDFLGYEVHKAVVCCPANFIDSAKSATKVAAEIAGLEVVRMLVEPSAACLAYRLGDDAGKKTILICDLGTNSSDISIVEINEGIYKVISTSGSLYAAGVEFDRNLTDYCMKEFKKKNKIDISNNVKAKNRLKLACEQAKKNLSSQLSTDINIDSLAEGVDFNITISRAKFEDRKSVV